MQTRKKTFSQGAGLVGSETRSAGPNWSERSVQSPDRRRVYPEMNVRSAGLVANRKVFVDMAKRMRCGGHNAPSVLCRMAVAVNLKTVLVRPSARDRAAELLFEKANDDWLGQSSEDAGNPQEKSRFQHTTFRFGRAFRRNVNFFSSSHDRRDQQPNRNRAHNPRHRLTPNRPTDLGRKVRFLSNAAEPSLDVLTRTSDLLLQFLG